MNAPDLIRIARALVGGHKGLLAMDESTDRHVLRALR